MELNLEIIDKEEMNLYKHAYLYFYTEDESDLQLLVLKKNEEDSFSGIEATVQRSDNVPPFAISRVITSTYRGLFSAANIERMQKGEALTNKNISEKDFYYTFELWNEPVYNEWLDSLSDHPIIQYDTIRGILIYFVKLPLLNLQNVNKNLKDIGYSYELAYLNYSQFISGTSELKLQEKNALLLKHFTVDLFIKETEDAIKSDALDIFVVLAVKPPSEKKSDQAGFFHFPSLFQGLYRKNTERWIYCVCSTHDLPTPEILDRCKCIVIPGSHISVYNDFPFIKDTEEYLRKVHEGHSKVKILGICFGQQLLVQALGGEVKKMEGREFVRHPEEIIFDEKFWNFEFVKKSKIEKSKSLIISQAHGDEVTVLPESSKLRNYASSETCEREILVSDDERIFCIQGHPEYNTDFTMGRVAPFFLQREGKEVNTENILKSIDEWKKSIKRSELNDKEFRRLCYSFLKY